MRHQTREAQQAREAKLDALHTKLSESVGVRFPPDRRGIDNEDRDAREAEEVRPGVP